MMTKEKRRKIGIIGVCAMLAIFAINDVTFNHVLVDTFALLALVAAAFIATAMYIRDNGPLTQREKMKEFAPVILILILMVFVVPQML